MKCDIIIQIQQDIGEGQYDFEKRASKYEKIFRILINKGALDGVKGGSAKIHFNETGNFMGIELDYWPYRERPLDKK